MLGDPREDIFWPNVKSSWDLKQSLGLIPARISVRNLQAIIRVGKDAWGREGKVQPVLISATVSLRQPFSTASVQDAVNQTTIHYGTLSKAILEAAQEFHEERSQASAQTKQSSVKYLIHHVEKNLAPQLTLPTEQREQVALLDRFMVNSLKLEVTLPKALLNSTTGVSRISTIGFDLDGKREKDYMGMSLVLRDLRVSALIGVNSNERLAKQLVNANIELDVWVMEKDLYNELEQIVVKTIEESSFQTLESLALHLAWRITRYFIHPYFVKPFKAGEEGEKPLIFPSAKINLSKPTAVILADAPEVEILVASSDLLRRALPCTAELPFPLQGRLDEWITRHDTQGLSKDPVLGG